ncbi:hypothetical protein LINPERHAP1_LOCUS31855 [Linum perenne]
MESRQGCPPVKECEVEALVQALEWTRDLGMNRAIIETDSQLVQLAMNGTGNDRTEVDDIIAKGKSLLIDQPRKKVDFMRRSGNTVAHALASRYSCLMWFLHQNLRPGFVIRYLTFV